MSKGKEEHLDFQRHFFDRLVGVFTRPIPDDVVERSREIVRLAVKDEKQRILDVGTGVGVFLGYYHELGVPFENMLGCDLSSGMLEEAKKRYPQVKFWQGDVLELPDEFAPFDLIVFNACFGNIIDQDAVLLKSKSLLNENGRIAITQPMGNSFVKQLQEAEPELVLTLLPDSEKLAYFADMLKMSILHFRDESNLYVAVLEKP